MSPCCSLRPRTEAWCSIRTAHSFIRREPGFAGTDRFQLRRLRLSSGVRRGHRPHRGYDRRRRRLQCRRRRQRRRLSRRGRQILARSTNCSPTAITTAGSTPRTTRSGETTPRPSSSPSQATTTLTTVVDGSDYLAWKASFGSVDDLRADGNHDGRVNAADYTVWRNNLSAGGGGGGAGSLAAATQAPAAQSEPSPLIAAAGNLPTASQPAANRADLLLATAPATSLQSADSNVHDAAKQLRRSMQSNRAAYAPSLLLAVTTRPWHADHTLEQAAQLGDQERFTDAAFAEWPRQLSQLCKLDTP